MAGVSFLHFLTPLVEREEEEIGSYPFTGNAWGFARVGAGTVAHRTVTFDLADAGAAAVAHRAVAVKLADAGARAVADGAVAVEPTDAGARAVADGAVALNLTAARTAAVVDGLRHCARSQHDGDRHDQNT